MQLAHQPVHELESAVLRHIKRCATAGGVRPFVQRAELRVAHAPGSRVAGHVQLQLHADALRQIDIGVNTQLSESVQAVVFTRILARSTTFCMSASE